MDKERFRAELQFKKEEHQLDMRFKQEEHKQSLAIADATAAAQIRNQSMMAESRNGEGQE